MVAIGDVLDTLSAIGDNRDQLRRLEVQLASRVGVVPFVGAGLSVPYGYRGWRAFLTEQAQQAGIVDTIARRLDAGQYEEAAEDLLDARRPLAFHDAIEATFGPHVICGRTLDGAIMQLPSLAIGPVVTTNFDPLLEAAFAQAGREFESVALGARADAVASAVRNDARILLKLHGDSRERSDRILTRQDYERHYGTSGGPGSSVDPTLPLPHLLGLLLLSRVVLFVGCSLEQDRTVLVLRQIAATYPEVAQFAIVSAPSSRDAFNRRARFLSDRGIRPIWYPQGRHDLIEPLLGHFAEVAGNSGLAQSHGSAGVVWSGNTRLQEGGATKLPLVRARDLTRERMGDDLAASFPLVTTPQLQRARATAADVLTAFTCHATPPKRGILVVGESNVGKTRLAFDVLTSTLPDWYVVRWQFGAHEAQLPFTEIRSRNVAVFVDDLHEYVLGDAAGTEANSLRTTLTRMRNTNPRIPIIATCRTEDGKRVHASTLSYLFEELEVIELATLPKDSSDAETARVIAELASKGRIEVNQYDGTIGSLVLGLGRKQAQYCQLGDSPPAYVLRATKLLYRVDIMHSTFDRVRAVCAGVYGQTALRDDEATWRTAKERLEELEFVSVECVDDGGVLRVRKEVYFDCVIVDESRESESQLLLDLLRLRDVLAACGDWIALLQLAHSLASRGYYEQALRAFDEVLVIEPIVADAWLEKGLVLHGLGRYDDAAAAFGKAVELTNESAGPWLRGDPDVAEALREVVNTGAKDLGAGMLLAAGRWAEALDALESLKEMVLAESRDVRDRSLFYRHTGIALCRLGRYDEAIDALDKAIELVPSDTWTRWFKAHVLAIGLRHEEALQAYKQAAAFAPLSGEEAIVVLHLVERTGVALFRSRHYAAASEAYDIVLQFEPHNAATWYRKGLALAALDDQKQAAEAYTRAIECKDDYLKAWLAQEKTRNNVDQYEREVTFDDAALQFDSTAFVVWMCKGKALDALGRYEDALDAYDCALQIRNDAVAWADKGTALMHWGRHSEALQAYDQAIQLGTAGSLPWYGKLVVLHKLGQYADEVEAHDKILQLDPEDYFAWRNKGRVLFMLQRYQAAVEAFDRAIQLKDDDDNLWHARGWALELAGRYTEAVTSYRRALTMNEGASWSWRNLADVLLTHLGLPDEALEASKHVIRIAPDSISGWAVMGDVHAAQGRAEEARKAYETAIGPSPSNTEGWYWRGRAYIGLQMSRAALECLDHTIALDQATGDPWGLKARALRSAIDVGTKDEAERRHGESRDI